METLYFLDVNEAAIAAYGFSRLEFLLMTLRDIRPAEDVPQVEGDVRVSRESGVFRSGNRWRHLRKDGTGLWVNITSLPIIFGGSEARLVTANDITQNVEKSLALSHANRELEKLSLVVKLTGNSVMILNTKRQIVWGNDAFTALTGYSLAEAAGKKPSRSCMARIPPGPLPFASIQRPLTKKSPLPRRSFIIRKPGNNIGYWQMASPYHSRMAARRNIIVETDITELKKKRRR